MNPDDKSATGMLAGPEAEGAAPIAARPAGPLLKTEDSNAPTVIVPPNAGIDGAFPAAKSGSEALPAGPEGPPGPASVTHEPGLEKACGEKPGLA